MNITQFICSHTDKAYYFTCNKGDCIQQLAQPVKEKTDNSCDTVY